MQCLIVERGFRPTNEIFIKSAYQTTTLASTFGSTDSSFYGTPFNWCIILKCKKYGNKIVMLLHVIVLVICKRISTLFKKEECV